MAIWLPERDVWTNRPTEVPRINWSNPLTKGLEVAWIGGKWRNVDLTGKRLLSVNVPGGLSLKGGETEFLETAGTRITFGVLPSSDPLGGNVTGEISVATAFTADDAGGGGFGRIIDKSNGGVAANGWALYLWSSSNSIQFVTSAGATTLTMTSAWTAGVPMSMCVTAKNGSQIAYKDGVSFTSSSAALTYPSTSTIPIAIGNWNHTTGREFDGVIDYVYVWSRVISELEQKSIYFNPWQIFE